jgi:hypothetical protein
LILLAFPIPLSQFPAPSMKDHTGEAMSCFAAVQLDQGTPALRFVVDKTQRMQGLFDTPELANGLR